MIAPDFDPASKDFLESPYPVFRRLREFSPVHWNERLESWVVSRYDDCLEVLRDHDAFAADPRHVGASLPPSRVSLQTTDGPEHAAIQRVLLRALHAVDVRQVDNYVTGAVRAAVRNAPDPRAVDFVQDIALPVTTSTTVSLLGLSPEVVAQITEASAAIVRSMMHGLIPGGDRVGIPERALVSQIIDAALDGADGGLLGMIRGDRDHGTVDRQALVNSIRVVVLAGINSTQRTLSLAMNSLLTAHGTLQKFAAATDKVRAVNELVRYDGSAQSAARFCTRPIAFHGCNFTEGESVIALLGSANRDDRRFPDPDDLILDRLPNPHLGFGRGEHACLGIPLAHQINISVLGYFAAHYPNVALGLGQQPVIEPNPALRGFLSLQLALR